MMSGFDSTTAKSSMRPPIAAGPISRNLSPLKISTAGFGSAANAATDTNRASSAVFMAANSTRDGGAVARETPSRGGRGEEEGRSPRILRRGFEFDRAAERFRGRYGDVLVAEERFEGVVETGVLAFVGFRGVVHVAAVADHAFAIDDEDVRRHAGAVRASDAAIAVLEIGEWVVLRLC